MKKFIMIIAVAGMFTTGCGTATTTGTVTKNDSTSVKTVDTTKKTAIIIAPVVKTDSTKKDTTKK